MSAFSLDEARHLARLVAMRKLKVHALTNPVARVLTAHALAALGVEPSMSENPRDMLAMLRGSDALLVNLGMLDAAREATIEALLEQPGEWAVPLVLDPVKADRAPSRQAITRRFLTVPRLVVKGNIDEMAALREVLPSDTLRITTGPTDRVETDRLLFEIGGGHPLMARFSGSGCLAGGVIAAFAAVEPDLARASAAALTTLRHAAAEAGAKASGPGTFVPLLIDALANFSGE